MSGRRIIAWWAGLLGWLSGCAVMINGGGCGGKPALLHHPQLQLVQARYTPAGPVSPGTILTVTAKMNLPSTACQLAFQAVPRIPQHGGKYQVSPEFTQAIDIPLHDDGLDADALAGDGIWSGAGAITGRESKSLETSVMVHYRKRYGQPQYMDDYMGLPPLELMVAADAGKSADGKAPRGGAE